MKKIFAVLAVFALAFSVNNVYAQKIETRENLKSEIETRKQELETKKQDVEAKRAEVKNRIAERLGETMTKSSERLTRELRRFRETQTKIESRIIKLEKQGAVATEAREALGIAIEKLSLAETAIGTIGAVVISSENPKASLEEIKTEVRATLEALKEARRALVNVLPAMRGLQASVSRSATSTRESN